MFPRLYLVKRTAISRDSPKVDEKSYEHDHTSSTNPGRRRRASMVCSIVASSTHRETEFTAISKAAGSIKDDG
jgi:hypothetical protein